MRTMPAEETMTAEAPRRMAMIRLAFGALFWRVVLVSFIIWELLLWAFLRRLGLRGRRRFAGFLLLSPRMFCYAFLLGAAVAVATDLFVRLVLDPLVRRWYAPRRPDESMGAPLFHLGAHETVVAEVPARLDGGRLWPPGTLVLTSGRIGFFPFAWDAEPWLVPLDRLRGVRVEPPPRFALGFIRGLPDRLVLRDSSDLERRFAVADPRVILDWLKGSPAPQYLHLD